MEPLPAGALRHATAWSAQSCGSARHRQKFRTRFNSHATLKFVRQWEIDLRSLDPARAENALSTKANCGSCCANREFTLSYVIFSEFLILPLNPWRALSFTS